MSEFDADAPPGLRRRADRRRGFTSFVMGGTALLVGLPMFLLGPRVGVVGLWIGGVVGVLFAIVMLIVGLVRYSGRRPTTYSLKVWHAVAIGAGLPIFIFLVLEGFASTAA